MDNAAVNFKVVSKHYTAKLTHFSCEAQGRKTPEDLLYAIEDIHLQE